jgi:polyhydroxybutyrate depolymerase
MPSAELVSSAAFGAAVVVTLTASGCAAGGSGSSPDAPGAPDAGGAEVRPDAAILDDGRAPDAALPTCAPSTWTPGTDETVSLEHDGATRSYVVHVGDAVAADAPAPLLLNFHGYNNSPSIQASFSQMNALADVEGFVVVYPQGIGASFNAGACCGTAASQDLDDVGFARAIVADVEERICVDRRRVYATGFSNGGYMSYRLGCEAADLFAAIAPVSGSNAVTPCEPGRPVPVIAFHGDADTIVSYQGDRATIEGWAERDGCTAGPERTAYGASYCDRWTGCADDVAVEFCTNAGGWHLWPSATAAHPASPAIWSFLSQYRLP